jgi:hypothetical protein
MPQYLIYVHSCNAAFIEFEKYGNPIFLVVKPTIRLSLVDMQNCGQEMLTLAQIYKIYKAISFAGSSAYFHIIGVNFSRVFL